MHWTKRAQYTKKVHMIVNSHIRNVQSTLPVTVTFCRVGKRELDVDGLGASFKAAQDCVAMHLFPGSKSGQRDNHPSITWEYTQAKVQKGEDPHFTIEFNFVDIK